MEKAKEMESQYDQDSNMHSICQKDLEAEILSLANRLKISLEVSSSSKNKDKIASENVAAEKINTSQPISGTSIWDSIITMTGRLLYSTITTLGSKNLVDVNSKEASQSGENSTPVNANKNIKPKSTPTPKRIVTTDLKRSKTTPVIPKRNNGASKNMPKNKMTSKVSSSHVNVEQIENQEKQQLKKLISMMAIYQNNMKNEFEDLNKKSNEQVEKLSNQVNDLKEKNKCLSTDKMKLQEKLQSIKPQECCICVDSIANCVITPCGHVTICTGCQKKWRYKLSKCPICNTLISSAIRIYL